MSADEFAAPARIDRVVDLEVDRSTLWRLISTEEGWRDWLVDEAELVDGAGVVVDRDVVRHVRFDEVRAERSVGFTWWEHDDPASVSHVTLEIVDDGEHARLRIAEQLLAGTVRTPEAKLAWEVRVCSLWACTVAAALV
jgi:hypothetical protein